MIGLYNFERIRIFCNCAGTIDSEKFIEIDTMLWNNIGLTPLYFLHFLYTTLDPLIKQVYHYTEEVKQQFSEPSCKHCLNNVLCSMLCMTPKNMRFSAITCDLRIRFEFNKDRNVRREILYLIVAFTTNCIFTSTWNEINTV
uniref:Uncharacterized protein n=1 Tax=Heterorhabditis bacteriophora TaxID=37862 RepID=A0A1I7WGW5_HETBA